VHSTDRSVELWFSLSEQGLGGCTAHKPVDGSGTTGVLSTGVGPNRKLFSLVMQQQQGAAHKAKW
jgi:hypothetical protein